MLYVSTRNKVDTYTAYRALHESCAPDGGIYVPFRLPVFSTDEVEDLQKQSYCKIVAQILNLFFGLRLGDLEVELAIGRNPVRMESMAHKLQMAELWRNPEMSSMYLLKRLYGLTAGKETLPTGWARIAIQIALLFGMISLHGEETQTFDLAVDASDFSAVAAVCMAKHMGLPVGLTVCASVDDSTLWDLLNRGECAVADKEGASYWEALISTVLGTDSAIDYFLTQNERKNFHIDELQQENLQNVLFASVASADRVDSVRSSILRSNAYNASADAALAFGGLQDYRSTTGISKDTVILALTRPDRVKE